MSKSYAEAKAGRRSVHPSGGPTSTSGRSPPASEWPQTVLIQALQNVGSAGDLLTALKNQRVDSLCLQRQPTRYYLLSVAHPEQKMKLLFLGTIYDKDLAYWIDDPDHKVTFINVFGTQFELSDLG